MTNWSYDDATKSGILTLQGELTISHVGEIRNALVEAFDSAERVTVDVSSTTDVDVAGVQLLFACRRTSTAHGKKVCLRLGDNKRFADFLEEIGFPPDFICNHGEQEMCE